MNPPQTSTNFRQRSPNPLDAESFGTTDNGTDLMDAMSATFEKGYYLPSDKPGFGTELTEKLVMEHAIA